MKVRKVTSEVFEAERVAKDEWVVYGAGKVVTYSDEVFRRTFEPVLEEVSP